MNFIELAVRWRHGTFVLFCLLAMLGILALFRLPLELHVEGAVAGLVEHVPDDHHGHQEDRQGDQDFEQGQTGPG